MGVEVEVQAGEEALHQEARQHRDEENDDRQRVQDREQTRHRGEADAGSKQPDGRPDDPGDLVELVLSMPKLVVELRVLVERNVQRSGLFHNAFLGAELDPLA